MNIEQTIQPISPVFLQSDSTKIHRNRETFHDIFQRTLNQTSSSRPPKMELTGILIPIAKSGRLSQCDFKLETDQNEYRLRMNKAVFEIAKQLEWEEVTVKGYLVPEEGIFEVERISLSNKNEPYRFSLGPADLYFELDQYRRAIARKGLLDIAPEYLAS
ncbi:MAG: hypothetical protein ACXWC9_10600 [Pseudobdellovibrionaceae bacterium]